MDDSLLLQLKKFTILCVEDEDIIREGIVNTLKYYFKDVMDASNANDAYDLYLEYKPDIILSDIQMPGKNGISMIEDIRKNDLSTIIVIITAYSSEEYLLELINLHISHYIIKPVHSENLLDGLVKSLADKLDKKLVFNKELYFDMKTYKLVYNMEELNLRKRDIDFLLLLFENKNQVLHYDLIEEHLWKDKSMSISALKTFIKEFRKRIPIDIITNVLQVGYKLKEFKS